MARRFWSVSVVAALMTMALPAGAVVTDSPEAPERARCTIAGTSGSDTLRGTKRADVICGRGGADRLLGAGGKDTLIGGSGADVLTGGAGRDRIVGGPGNDRMIGGPGDDTILARDKKKNRDRVRCGPGRDTVTADRRDRVAADCERVDRLWPPSGVTLAPATVAENAPSGTVVGLLSATDRDRGDTHVFSLVTGPGSDDNAGFAILGRGLRTLGGLDFETDPLLSVRVRATDSTGLVREQVLAVTVTDVPENAAPVAGDDALTGTEDTTLVVDPADLLANDTDAEGDPLTVTSVSDAVGASVSLVGGNVEVVPDADVCVPDEVAFDYVVSDGLGGTDTGHVSVDLTCVPDPVVAEGDSALVTEDDGPVVVPVLDNEDNPDHVALTIASATDPANGSVLVNGGGTELTYQPDPDYCNDPPGGTPDTFDYTLDQGGTSATVEVTVTCVDDAPVAVDDAATVFEGAAATAVPVLGNDTDVDAGPLTVAGTSDPANGTVVVTGGGTGLTYEPDADYCNDPPGGAPDTFTYTLNGGSTATVSVTVTCDDPPTAVDDATSVGEDPGPVAVDVLANDLNADGGPLVIESTTDPANGTVDITGGGTGLTYEPAHDYCNDPPGGAPDTFTYTLNGGSTATVSVTVTCADDPSVAADDAATVAEDPGPVAIDVLTNDTDVDGGGLTIIGASDPAHGAVVVTGGGTGLTYEPDPDYCNAPPGTDLDTFTYTLAGGDEATVTVTVTCVNDAPVADDETFTGALSAIGNTTLVVDDPLDAAPSAAGARKVISGAILAGDSDVDGPGPLAVVAGTFPTADGGTVALEADGDFTFIPAAGTSCTDTSDSFSYTLTDQATPTPATDTGLVTISLTGCVWYVDNAAAGNAGTSAAPFDTLAQAQAASAPGDVIHVAEGDGTTSGYASGIVLKAGQRLVGTAVDLQVGGDLLLAGVPTARPTLSNVNADVVTLAAGTTVTGLDVDPQGAGGGLFGGAGVAGGTVRDVSVLDTGVLGTQPGLELDGTTGTTVLQDLTVVTSGAVGVRVASAGTVLFEPTGTISITTTGTRGLTVSTTAVGTSAIDDVTVSGSSNGAVMMTFTSGSMSFTDLDLATTSGAVAPLVLVNAGTVDVPASGTADLSAQGGPAVDLSATTATLAFDDVTSSGSPGQGISLDGLGAGTFSAATGAIDGAAGTAFVVSGTSSGDITFPGPITDGTGQTASITGRTGGTVTLSGDLTDGADAGGGISVSGNSGGTTMFSGAVKSFSTGAGAGVSLASNTGHTVSFTNGGLAITSTSGGGLLSSGGGTLVVAGNGNTVTSGTGGAVLIDNTTIGAGNATFQSVTTNGATVGIRANNTGGVGRLIVTGTGGTCVSGNASGCSGGELANGPGPDDGSATPGGTGIVLNSTLNPSFTRMWVHDFQNYAVRGTSVAGLTLANSLVNGSNGTNGAAPYDDSSVRLDNLTGSATVSDTYVAGGFEDNLRVVNTAGSLDRITLTGVTFGVEGNRPTNDALLLESSATAGQLHATITGSTFSSAAGDLFQLNHGGSGSGDLVLTGNTFSNAHPSIATGGGGVSLFQSGTSGTTSMAVSGNSFRDAVGPGVLVVKSAGPSTQSGTFANNSIGVTGVADSGSREGSALKLQLVSQGTSTWSVTGNVVRGYNNHGIEVLAGGGGVAASGTLNTTLTGNDIAQPGTFAGTAAVVKQGIHYNIGTVPGDTFQVCADIRTNAISSSGADGSPPTGVDVDVRLRQRQLTTIRLPGYGGAANDNNAVQSFVNANNSPGTTSLAANNVAGGAGGFTGAGTTCP